MTKSSVIRHIRDAWLILGISLLLFAIVEATLCLAFRTWDHFTPCIPVSESESDPRVRADVYRNAPWANDYFKEFGESHVARWEPYLYWRRKPYNGKYIHINADGIRLTTDPSIARGQNRPTARIFVFGGSTMWGTGARDPFTIPSLLAKGLRKAGVNAEIINFAELGYVNTQELIALILELRQQNIPDMVIFYDGVNDAFSAYQAGRAGIPQNEFNRVQQFRGSARPPRSRLTDVVRDRSQQLSTVRLLTTLRRKLLPQKEIVQTKPEHTPDRYATNYGLDEQRLAEDVVSVFLRNMEIVKALATSYKFKCLFYWQPTIFGKPTLTDYEKNEYRKQEDFGRFLTKTNSAMGQRERALPKDGTFHNLSGIFSGIHEPVYIDWCHLGEGGNEVIAAEMLKHILPSMQSHGNSPGKDTPHDADVAAPTRDR